MTISSSMTITNRTCPSCKKKSNFRYEGIQEGIKGVKKPIDDTALYTCLSCKSTIFFTALRKVNPGMY